MSTSEVPTGSFISSKATDIFGASARTLFQHEELSKTVSPISQLARNLEDLSTSRHAVLPRRKLSLSSCTPNATLNFNTPDSTKPNISKQLSVDEGCSLDSPGFEPVDSPFIQHRFGNLQNAFFSPQDQNDSWVETRPKTKKFKTLPLTFYGFGSSSKPNNGTISRLDLDKTSNDGEGNEDESSQDSGVGIELPLVVSSAVLVDETNSLDRWIREEKRNCTRRRVVAPLVRSVSVPGTVEIPAVKSAFNSRLKNALKPLNVQTLLSPVRDVDDGFAELNEIDSELLLLEEINSHLSDASSSTALQILANRKRRFDDKTANDCENERPQVSSKLRRNLSHTGSAVCSPCDSIAGNQSGTPTSSKTGAKWTKPLGELQLNEGGQSVKSSRRLVRCHSEAVIRSALSSADEHPNLVGDFSRPYSLPVITGGKHQDLKSITPDTMAKVLNNQFADVSNYVIVDCRYPYEFEGGHLAGAKNIYTKEGIVEEFLKTVKRADQSDSTQHKIIIFHCEFSSERGPKLMRFLRNKDRDSHRDCYPTLHYPECYLLEGGYRAFFEIHSHLCEPQSYRQMVDPQHAADLKHFRSKSRSLPTTNAEDPGKQRRARSCLKL